MESRRNTKNGQRSAHLLLLLLLILLSSTNGFFLFFLILTLTLKLADFETLDRRMRPGDPMSPEDEAVSAVERGYDISAELRLAGCRPGTSGPRLIELDGALVHDLALPGGVTVRDVPKSIKCDKGERTRFCSDVLPFHQMSEQINQGIGLSGKIPSGLFNAMFDFRGWWQKDMSSTKSLCFDGWSISLYSIELARSHIVLTDEVKRDVPSSWDPPALAEFIEKYGTHIITGVKMGGKDVVSIKQQQDSVLPQSVVQNLLKILADDRFSEDFNGNFTLGTDELSTKVKAGTKQFWVYKYCQEVLCRFISCAT